MNENWVRYEDVEETRNGYFVVYSPVFTGQDSATLKINVYESELVGKLKEIAEEELKIWAQRYATPIMVLIKEYGHSDWTTKDVLGHDFLLGYQQGDKTIIHWDIYPEGEQPNFDLSKEKLEAIYVGLASKTLKDVIKKQTNEAKGKNILLLLAIFWFCLIPAFIAYLGWSSPFFSLLALAYSWYIVINKLLQILGKKGKSQAEIDKEREELEKEHHHYHCKLNPKAFLALKCENFKNERISKEIKKIDDVKS
ncbi:hypothetical protein AAGU50_15600 [Aeromonas dhakensis]|uniref:hypothetical protein n=1 Tax=Aeromonas dhakensis TaxID=196024 RepID=UPI003BA2975A